jgi:hypothetical protein
MSQLLRLRQTGAIDEEEFLERTAGVAARHPGFEPPPPELVALSAANASEARKRGELDKRVTRGALAFVALAILGVVRIMVWGGSSTGWSDATEASFVQSCTASAVQAGSIPPDADASCGCFLRGLEALYSQAEFETLDAAMAPGQAMPDEASQVVADCRIDPQAH